MEEELNDVNIMESEDMVSSLLDFKKLKLELIHQSKSQSLSYDNSDPMSSNLSTMNYDNLNNILNNNNSNINHHHYLLRKELEVMFAPITLIPMNTINSKNFTKII